MCGCSKSYRQEPGSPQPLRQRWALVACGTRGFVGFCVGFVGFLGSFIQSPPESGVQKAQIWYQSVAAGSRLRPPQRLGDDFCRALQLILIYFGILSGLGKLARRMGMELSNDYGNYIRTGRERFIARLWHSIGYAGRLVFLVAANGICSAGLEGRSNKLKHIYTEL
jgi:hypothetical protein